MKKFLIFAVAVLGLAACKESKVEPQADKLKLNVSEVSISVSETFQLSANLNVTWASSNYEVASISSTGLVRGVKEGTTTITATSIDNQKATCKVIVTSDSGGGDDPIKEKPAYCIEYVTSYTDVEEGLNLPTGVVLRIIYERGDDPKYLLSTTQYGVNGMNVKTEYTNSGQYQYGVCTYCNDGSTFVGAKDTTIYLDDARLYTKEYRSSSYKTVYEYDADNRVISSVMYVAGEKYQELHYKYETGYRYGEGIYFENGLQMRDTIEYEGLSFDYRSTKRQVTIIENLEKGTYSLNEYVYQLEGGRRKSCTYRDYRNDNGVEREYIYYSTFTWYNDWDYTQRTIYDLNDYSYTSETTYRYRQ